MKGPHVTDLFFADLGAGPLLSESEYYRSGTPARKRKRKSKKRKNKYIMVVLKSRQKFLFAGRYLGHFHPATPKIDRPNWHYYETSAGDIFHFKADDMATVFEATSKKRFNDFINSTTKELE